MQEAIKMAMKASLYSGESGPARLLCVIEMYMYSSYTTSMVIRLVSIWECNTTYPCVQNDANEEEL